MAGKHLADLQRERSRNEELTLELKRLRQPSQGDGEDGVGYVGGPPMPHE